jgi:hypothetical protein
MKDSILLKEAVCFQRAVRYASKQGRVRDILVWWNMSCFQMCFPVDVHASVSPLLDVLRQNLQYASHAVSAEEHTSIWSGCQVSRSTDFTVLRARYQYHVCQLESIRLTFADMSSHRSMNSRTSNADEASTARAQTRSTVVCLAAAHEDTHMFQDAHLASGGHKNI